MQLDLAGDDWGLLFFMKLIPLNSKKGKDKGKYFALVDDEDYDWLMQWNWKITKRKNSRTQYAVRTCKDPITGKSTSKSMHREILGLTNRHELCDHINHNGFDNRRCNLRKTTAKENSRNRRPKRISSSKYLGVRCRTRHIKYTKKDGDISTYSLSSIHAKILNIDLGTFKTEEEAARAYDKKAIELYGEFANLNFPLVQMDKNNVAINW